MGMLGKKTAEAGAAMARMENKDRKSGSWREGLDAPFFLAYYVNTTDK